FFYLPIPRAPVSTLFPYTTLFRSGERLHPLGAAALAAALVELVAGARRLVLRQAGVEQLLAERLQIFELETLGAIADLVGLLGLDRKSTRLNSSHVAISYAVFCLK